MLVRKGTYYIMYATSYGDARQNPTFGGFCCLNDPLLTEQLLTFTRPVCAAFELKVKCPFELKWANRLININIRKTNIIFLRIL